MKKRIKDGDRKTRIAYILEAGFEYFISLFVTGTMLGYILDTVGFSDAQQGIISTVATFACGAQLFALVVTPKSKKRFATALHLINQLCFVLLYLLPIFNIPSIVKTVTLMILLIGGHVISNAVVPVKTVWLMSSVQNNKRGAFTAVKEMISLAGGIIVSLIFGAVADTFRDASGMPTRPYYIICAAAVLIMMIIHTVTLLVSDEKDVSQLQRPSVRDTVGRMVHNVDLIKVIGVGVMWNIASGVSVSFYASYVREELAFTFTVIAFIGTLGSICRILVSPLLGKIADRYSFSTSMTLSFVIVAIAFLCMVLTTPQTRWLYIGYVCLHAFSMAGINSGVINLIYDYVPPTDRATALGVKNALGGILGFLAALLSGAVLGKIQGAGGFRIFGATLYAQQVLSFGSLLVCVLLIIYMRVVIKPLHRVDTLENEPTKEEILKLSDK